MTAPARTRTSAAKKGQSEREQAAERTRARANPRGRARSAAAERAYARKEERGKRSGTAATERRARKPQQDPASRQDQRRSQSRAQPKKQRATQPKARTQAPSKTQSPSKTQAQQAGLPKAQQFRAKVTTSRAPFVIAVMAVLAAGIVGTLWLSIAAVSNSYELRQAEVRVNALSERKETLIGQVSTMNSTPAVQRRAEKLGLVPGPNPAHLLPRPDGSVKVVGEPKAAKAPRPAPPPAAPPPAPRDQGSPTQARQASSVPEVGRR